MIINSNALTLIDTTDTKKINVHISSNHPNVQIYDVNKMTYTPSWVDGTTTDPLKLDATVYADSIDVTSLANIQWFKDDTKGSSIATGSSLTISENVLNAETSIVEYICKAKYNNTDYENKITFTLITTGRDGVDGQPGKDGLDGKDGTSVHIEGTAYAKTTPMTGSNIDLYSDVATTKPITGTATGESYLVDGYLCVYNTTDKKFICTGKIQGPKGEQGDSSYLFVRYAEDVNGKNMSDSSDGKTYIGFYRSSVNVAPTDPTSIKNWTKFVGTPASIVTITPSALYFKSTEGKNGTFTPEHIYLYPRFQNVTFSKWEYSLDGGITWSNASGANGLTISTYNNVANTLRISRTSTLYTDTITSISFRCLSSNNAIYDTVSVIKIYDVVDLKIGGRNLARYTDSENWVNYRSATLSFSEGTRSKRVKAICNATDTATGAVFGIQQGNPSKLMKLKSGQEYTLSFLIRGNIPNLNYTYLMNEGTSNQNIQGIDAKSISETNFTKITKTFVANDYADLSTGSYLMISSIGPTDTSLWFEIEEVQLEAGQIATDWSLAPEDILDSAANVNVMLSNEAHFFEADSKGVPTATSIVLDVVGFKGSIQSPTKIETITGLPSAGMTATIANNNTTNTKITIAVTTALTSAIADYGTLTIPITVNGHIINKMFSWSKAKAGATGAKGDQGIQGLQGEKGDQGIQGPAGANGVSSYFHIKYSANANGNPMTETPSTYIGTYVDHTQADSDDYTKYTWSRFIGSQGAKGDQGIAGTNGVDGKTSYLHIAYATSSDGKTGFSVSDSVNKTYIGQYTDYTQNDSTDYTKYKWTLIKGDKGDKGDQGVQGPKGNDGQQYYTWIKYADTPTSGMSNDPDGKTYIGLAYNKTTATESTTYSDYAWSLIRGETGAVGPKGEDGKQYYTWIKYADNASGANMSDLPNGKLYIGLAYNKTTSTESNVASDYTWALFKGDKGDQGPKGNDAYTVMLTNESHIFAGDVSNAIAGSAATQVLAYNGSTAQTVTIVSVNGKTAATTDTDTGIAGLKFKCSALSGTSPTITFTCTTSFVSKSGAIPIVLSVGGVSFTKMFTYSIAFKGSTGAQGSTGTPASLVDITPSALYFKSTTGKDGTFTPDYIYLYPRFQTVTFSKWEYSVNGGTTWIAASGANGLTISTYNSVANTLRIAKTSTLYTDTVTSISFRCVSSNASVYDTVSIAKIYDVVDLQIGGRNLLTNSGYMTDLNGWCVYTANYPVNDLKLEANDIYGSVLTATGTAASSRIRVGQYIPYLQKANRILTFSMIYQASTDSTSVTAGGKYSELDNSGEYGSFSGTNTKRTDLGNGFTYMETTFNLTYTEATRSFFVYIYPGVQTTKIVYCKLEDGNKATANWSPAPEDLKTFQLYAPKGYLITKDVPEVTLQTFAYEGSRAITNATFKWYGWSGDNWIVISEAISDSLVVAKSDVLKSNVYKCEMTYQGIKYEATATVEDKTDIYESIMCISSNARGNDCYWVLYTLVYTDTEEVDPLLGPISINAPESPASGDYWYAIDETNASVQLKKYNGTSWTNSTDTQSLSYYWDIINNGSEKVPFGDHSKVQVVSCNDFTATATLVCGVNNVEDGLLTQSSLSLTDASDPIVSATEPSSVIDGQIWIKPNNNGTYIMSIWDATKNMWVVNDMDTRTKIHTSKPSTYSVGDLWITASDTEHSDYLEGTLLMASTSSSTFSESHWSTTLKYDKDLDSIKKTLNDLSQYVNITSEGLKIGAQSASGEISPFTSLFTSTELAFYQNSDKLLTLSNNQLTAPHIVVEDDLEVGKTISLGNLNLTIETNGSFSFTVTK